MKCYRCDQPLGPNDPQNEYAGTGQHTDCVTGTGKITDTRTYNISSHSGHNIAIHNPSYIWCRDCQLEVKWKTTVKRTNFVSTIHAGYGGEGYEEMS